MTQTDRSDLGARILSPGVDALDRDAERRGRPGLFDELWAEGTARILPLWNGKTLTREGPDGALRLDLRAVEQVQAALVRVYLGRTRGEAPRLPAGSAVVLETLTDAAAGELEPDTSAWRGLRELAPRLAAADAAILTSAVAIANWHVTAVYCPRCGMPTVVEQGGWVRRCFSDETMQFPRTDPAVIVAVTDGAGRLLLGSNAMWEHERYSVLAGFVEPGETFEQAAAREVWEEARLRVATPRYVGSQPWPFPASVMVGMTAELADGEDPAALTPDGDEIFALRWLDRDEVRRGDHGLLLPGPTTIARALIDDWYGGPIERAEGGRPPR